MSSDLEIRAAACRDLDRGNHLSTNRFCLDKRRLISRPCRHFSSMSHFMNSKRISSSALLVMSLAVTAGAHAQPTAASAPLVAAWMPQDCAKPMEKHSHAAEKGAPISSSRYGPCAPLASTSPKKDKTKHDHARDAKNQ